MADALPSTNNKSTSMEPQYTGKNKVIFVDDEEGFIVDNNVKKEHSFMHTDCLWFYTTIILLIALVVIIVLKVREDKGYRR